MLFYYSQLQSPPCGRMCCGVPRHNVILSTCSVAYISPVEIIHSLLIISAWDFNHPTPVFPHSTLLFIYTKFSNTTGRRAYGVMIISLTSFNRYFPTVAYSPTTAISVNCARPYTVCVCVRMVDAESRQFGYEARLRTQRDRTSLGVLIADPSQTALASDVIVAWQVYVKIVSVQHEVYLQVWRPAGA